MERILSMIIRQFLNKGINAGIKAASNRGAKKQGEEGDVQRAQNRQGQQNAQGLRRATSMLRRFGRF